MFGNENIKLLFINGINTARGGSAAGSNQFWENSLKKNGINHKIINSVPHIPILQTYYLENIFLAFYFLPGTFFRTFNSSLFEFLYKISPFLLIKIIIEIFLRNPEKIIFSHHSIFYLSVICSKTKRIFLIHDLIYARARSKGASRRLQRLYILFELHIYRNASTIFVQSYHEWRVLSKFLKIPVHLIGCCDLSLTVPTVASTNDIAVISDWRRSENRHGVVNFLAKPCLDCPGGRPIIFRVFGFDSSVVTAQLTSMKLPSNVKIIDGGRYESLLDIEECFFFVPIYEGAGIKRKTVEAFCSGRFVIGTKGAFVGLPPWMISKISWRVESLEDLQFLPALPELNEFEKSLYRLSQSFSMMGEIKDVWG